MSVTTNGSTIYAHESLSLLEIVKIIENDESLKSRFYYYTWKFHEHQSLIDYLQTARTLIRTRGRDQNKIKDWLHKPVLCECGCQVHQCNIYKHRKTAKHLKMLEAKNESNNLV